MSDNNLLKDTKLIVFKGTLRQDSALSTGGLIAKTSAQGYAPAMTDHPFMRDGKNRLVLRGSGLAGALIATARQLGYSTKQLEKLGILDTPTNHGDEHQKQRLAQRQHFSGSRWQVLNAHLATETHETMLRQGVAIQHDTSTAAQGALYDSETLPAGTQWNFTVECVMLGNPDHAKESLELLKAVLEHWEKGQAKFGASVARGLGWLTLIYCNAYNITKTTPYPNRLTIGSKKAEAFETQFSKNLIKNWQDYSLKPIDKKPNSIRISGKIIVGEINDDAWGLDTFASGSHIQSFHHNDATWQNHFSKAENEPQAKTDSDHRLPMTKNAKGQRVPFIPGGSIRGVLRHAFSRWYQLQGESIYDPTKQYDAMKENTEARDKVELLFGDHPHRHANKAQSSALLVRDAYLVGNDWKAVVLEHHAEDEFTASTFESAKFDRQVLLKGTFAFCMEIEINNDNKAIADAFCAFAQNITKARQLQLGGGVWRGYGSPKWEITVEKEQDYV